MEIIERLFYICFISLLLLQAKSEVSGRELDTKQVDISANPYTVTPFSPDYRVRKHFFFEYHRQHPGSNIHAELMNLAMGLPVQGKNILRVLEKIDAREDCSDFRLNGVLRMLFQFADSKLLSPGIRRKIRESVLGFKYWPDEPGTDSMCTWSENHHILFASGGFLAGQLFPDSIFRNSGKTGRQKMAEMRPRVIRWLDLRYQTGFSEWLSNVYYTQDVAALLNLIDFSKDREIATKAAMVLDLMLLDVALNQFQGTFGSTHGRSYFGNKTDGTRESTAGIFKLLFGLNIFKTNMASISLALSQKYRLPRVIYQIAMDTTRKVFENRQRMGLRLEEAKKWGLNFNRLEDGMTFLSFEAYAHPKTIGLFMKMMDKYHWWDNSFFQPFRSQKKVINFARKLHVLPLVAGIFERDLTRNMRSEVNIYTYKTHDYMLSSAQDYRKGYGGDQQHIWNATLGSKAISFTTHPVRPVIKSPNYWTGSGNLPRVAQYKNVAIILYHISTRPGLYVTHKLKFTHAWFPKSAFDEVVEQNSWVFARKNRGYLALWSQQPYHWQTAGEWKDKEIIAPGKKNIWICELGSEAEYRNFQNFVAKISSSLLRANGLSLNYHSPSRGSITFAWDSPLFINGKPIPLHNYPRYQNSFVSAPFPADTVQVRYNGHWLRLDFGNQTRCASDYLEAPASR